MFPPQVLKLMQITKTLVFTHLQTQVQLQLVLLVVLFLVHQPLHILHKKIGLSNKQLIQDQASLTLNGINYQMLPELQIMLLPEVVEMMKFMLLLLMIKEQLLVMQEQSLKNTLTFLKQRMVNIQQVLLLIGESILLLIRSIFTVVVLLLELQPQDTVHLQLTPQILTVVGIKMQMVLILVLLDHKH